MVILLPICIVGAAAFAVDVPPRSKELGIESHYAKIGHEEYNVGNYSFDAVKFSKVGVALVVDLPDKRRLQLVNYESIQLRGKSYKVDELGFGKLRKTEKLQFDAKEGFDTYILTPPLKGYGMLKYANGDYRVSYPDGRRLTLRNLEAVKYKGETYYIEDFYAAFKRNGENEEALDEDLALPIWDHLPGRRVSRQPRTREPIISKNGQ